MKNKLFNPIFIAKICAVLFIIGSINSRLFDVASWNDLFWWGQASAGLFMLGLLWILVLLKIRR